LTGEAPAAQQKWRVRIDDHDRVAGIRVPRHDRRSGDRQPQKPFRAFLCSRQEKGPVAQALPGFRLGPLMITKHDNLDAGLFGRRQDFGANLFGLYVL